MSFQKLLFSKEPLLAPLALVSPFSHRRVIADDNWEIRLSYSGRYALNRVLQALPHNADDEVLIPAFSCISLVESILAAGYRVRFFETTSLIHTSLDCVQEQLTAKSRILLIIHYFGFLQDTRDVAELCRRNGLLLVEDFAHALPIFDFKRRRDALAHCDIALFSMKKMLPVPDGAFVAYKSSLRIAIAPPRPPPAMVTLKELYWAVEHSLKSRVTQGSNALKSNTKPNTDTRAPAQPDYDAPPSTSDMPDKYVFAQERIQWGTSAATLRLCTSLDLVLIEALRRRNGAVIRTRLSALPFISFPLGEAADDMCLWALPFMHTTLPDFDVRLREQGVPVFTFARPLHPSLGTTGFEFARQLSRNLKLLPVHQGLRQEDIDLLQSAFARAHAPAGEAH